MIRIYNTLTARKEELKPLQPGKLGIYVCGPTVYEMSHIGHGRCYTAFDVIVRYLRRHYEVTFARNFTDVDDNIIRRAKELGESTVDLANRYADEYLTDMDALGIARPDIEPRVTGHIPQIVALIETLIEKGAAYESEGDVYYIVRGFEAYGRLGKRSIDDLESGARVEPGEQKRDPLDFALWKTAKPGEPSWDSPWGQGRPGWHIECSAMSAAHLGQTIDIHGGGKDLIFPHHENEIAQSEAAHGCTFARLWMHNGHLNIDNEKMSKSLDNFFTIREVLAQFDAQAVRFFLLTVHYRSPINFSDQNLIEAEERMRYLHETLARADGALGAAVSTAQADADLVARCEAAMNDDFNTPRVLAELADAFKELNSILDGAGAAGEAGDLDDGTRARLTALRAAVSDIGSFMGLFEESPEEVLQRMEARKRSEGGIDESQVAALIEARIQARADKDFARADQIRDELAAMGVTIKDSPTGTTWTAS